MVAMHKLLFILGKSGWALPKVVTIYIASSAIFYVFMISWMFYIIIT